MHKHSQGITLLELMITVAIVAILASIVYPSYQQQIRRSNRTEGKVELMKTAQNLEKCYTMASTYVGCAAAVLPYTTPNQRYEIAEGAAKVNATNFEITATAKGAQAEDVDCAVFSVTDANLQKAKTSGGTDNSAKCWK